MVAPLDEQYLTWLYGSIGSRKLRNSSRTYWSLARQLYTTEFVWFVPNDDNRVEDGRDLRIEFLNACEYDADDDEWLSLPCSMLEMLIGLSRRLSFEADGEPRDWFWHLIENLDLRHYNDRDYDRRAERHIEEVLNRVIFRQYDPDGHGGLFPLRDADKDQRKVELWYQMAHYLLELGI